MKRLIYIIIIGAMLLGMCACGSAPSASSPQESEPGTVSAAKTPEPVETEPAAAPEDKPSEPPEPEKTDAPAQPSQEPQPGNEPEPAENVDWQGIYTDFLNDNYDKLSQLIFGGIAGVGFADLDLDGVAEMILFDSGASASMGVQFFDVIDGKVQCVSANMEDLGSEFGGDSFTKLFVNANLFEDFRLVKNGDSAFFTVRSWNGALDFMYEEIITFGQGDETTTGAVLTLSSAAYRYDEYDVESGDTVTSRFERGGVGITEDEYNTIMASVQSWTDLDLDVKGAFIWENTDYAAGQTGLMAMVRDAAANYQPALDIIK